MNAFGETVHNYRAMTSNVRSGKGGGGRGGEEQPPTRTENRRILSGVLWNSCFWYNFHVDNMASDTRKGIYGIERCITRVSYALGRRKLYAAALELRRNAFLPRAPPRKPLSLSTFASSHGFAPDMGKQQPEVSFGGAVKSPSPLSKPTRLCGVDEAGRGGGGGGLVKGHGGSVCQVQLAVSSEEQQLPSLPRSPLN